MEGQRRAGTERRTIQANQLQSGTALSAGDSDARLRGITIPAFWRILYSIRGESAGCEGNHGAAGQREGLSWRGTPDEGPCAVSDYEAAVNQFVSEGLVDPDEIGMIGFSRTCFYVMEALTTGSSLSKPPRLTTA